MLYENREKYLSKETPKDRERYFLEYEDKEKKVTKFITDLNARKESLEIPVDKVSLINEAINYLFGSPTFPENIDDENSEVYEASLRFYDERKNSSIVYPNTFYRYFANILFEIDISDEEWASSLELDFDDLIKKLKNFIDRGARSEAYNRIALINEYKDNNHFENIVRAIFELSNYQLASDSSPYDAHFNQFILLSKIRDHKNIVKNYYNGDVGKYKLFLNDVLSNDKIPFIYCVSLIYYIVNDLNIHDKLVLTKEELLDINVGYLEKYLNSTDELDKIAWGLFYDCKAIILTKDMRSFQRISDKAREIMQVFFRQKGLKYFLERVAFKKGYDGFGFGDGVMHVFIKPENILEFVQNFKEKNLVLEFESYFEKARERAFQEYIPFDFKEINIKK